MTNFPARAEIHFVPLEGPASAGLFLFGTAFKGRVQPESLSIESHDMLTIMQAETPEQVATARQLMLEYAAAMNFSLCFQNFDEELRTLPGKYAPPRGRLLLANWDNRTAGLVGLRPLEDSGVCEMKRLYVRPEFRGKSLGRALAGAVIRQARDIGYTRMRLDTVQGVMDSAILLYRELGFCEIPAYYDSPVRETLFMELAL